MGVVLFLQSLTMSLPVNSKINTLNDTNYLAQTVTDIPSFSYYPKSTLKDTIYSLYELFLGPFLFF